MSLSPRWCICGGVGSQGQGYATAFLEAGQPFVTGSKISTIS